MTLGESLLLALELSTAGPATISLSIWTRQTMAKPPETSSMTMTVVFRRILFWPLKLLCRKDMAASWMFSLQEIKS